jgi:hypothetical protein
MNDGYIIVLILIGFGVLYLLNQILKRLNELLRLLEGKLDIVYKKLTDIDVSIWNVEKILKDKETK